jgi:hypothetical protein
MTIINHENPSPAIAIPAGALAGFYLLLDSNDPKHPDHLRNSPKIT